MKRALSGPTSLLAPTSPPLAGPICIFMHSTNVNYGVSLLTRLLRDSVIDVCGCIFIRGTRTPPANEARFVGSDKPSGTYIASIGRSHLHIYAFYKRQLRSLAIDPAR